MIPGWLWYFAQKVSLAIPFALAADGDDSGNTFRTDVIVLFNPLDKKELPDILQYILTGLTALAIPIVTIMIIIGAYYLITSGGNPGRRTKGKEYILWAVIGFAVLLLANSVVAITQSFLSS